MAITYLQDLRTIKERIENYKFTLLQGEVCNFHEPESHNFVRVICGEKHLRKIINHLLGKKGFIIKIYNIRHGFNNYPWYDTHIQIAKSFPNTKNIYDFSGFRVDST